MEITILEAESKLMGKNVLHINEWDSVEEILENQPDLIDKYDPDYVFCKIKTTDLTSIHLLEENGFRFSEFRVVSQLNIADIDIGTKAFYPFKVELIGNDEDLEKAIKILAASFDDDRFSNDPLIGYRFSKERVIANLRKSFNSFPNEFLLGLFNSTNDELVAFRSGAFISKMEAHYYQYGISTGFEFNHFSDMLEALTIDYLKRNGIGIIHAVSTGFNIAELNRLIKNYNFKIMSSFVLMRKVFSKKEKS